MIERLGTSGMGLLSEASCILFFVYIIPNLHIISNQKEFLLI